MGYQEEIIKNVLSQLNSGSLQPGIFSVQVCHDDDCPAINGGGDCNCDYEIKAPIELKNDNAIRKI